MSLKISDGITYITPSHYAKQCLETVGLKCQDIIPHGINLKETYDFAFHQRIKNFIPQPSKIEPSNIMLCVAGNVQRKALDKLLIAYKTIQKIIKDAFLILHSGIGNYNIVALQQALDLKRFWYTNMWGALDKQKLNALYKTCDFYVQPSLVEGFGLTYLEAFQFDKPVIGVNCPATNEIVKDGYTGFLIPVTRKENIIWQQRHAIQLHHFDVDNLIDSMLVMCDQQTRIKFQTEVTKEKKRWNMDKTYLKFMEYLN